MGCDIHAYAEVKINGRWQLYSHLRIQQDYALFARMANVRNYRFEPPIEPISLPRDLPANISKMTRFCREVDGSEGHSDSWMSGAEVDALCDWYNALQKKRKGVEWFSWEHETIGYIFGNSWDVKKYPNDYPKGVEDARLVFWFDN